MTTRKKAAFSLKKTLILLVILLVPGTIYYFLSGKVENKYKPLPYLGPKELSGTFHLSGEKKIADTIYHKVQPFTLIDGGGEKSSFPIREGTLSVVNFFYTRCPSFCYRMNREMNEVAMFFSKSDRVYLYSISVDSTDQPAVLRQYGKRFQKKNTNWKFLVGDQQKVFQLANQEFLLNALKDTLQDSIFIHSPYMVLLDAQQHIRGYYNATEREEVSRLINEIKLLLTEELRNRKATVI